MLDFINRIIAFLKPEPQKPLLCFYLQAKIDHPIQPQEHWALVQAPTLDEAKSKFRFQILSRLEIPPSMKYLAAPSIEIINHSVKKTVPGRKVSNGDSQ